MKFEPIKSYKELVWLKVCAVYEQEVVAEEGGDRGVAKMSFTH